MKRRTGNCDSGKPPRRQSKKTAKFDSVYGSSYIYIKFFLIWVFILSADFILEFRFEYLWPLWLLIQSCFETFKCQGLVYSMFFVCVAITSDTICFLFIPIQWLFFMASTYVWIHYVWHTEKGLCLPTILLWLVFMYVEATLRLKDLHNNPFNIELCRPFAAHCIGHPFVTLGIGFKSYVCYRLRLRTQRQIQTENNFYYELLKGSLPSPPQVTQQLAITDKDKSETLISNGGAHITSSKRPNDKRHQEAIETSRHQTSPPTSSTAKKSSGKSSSNKSAVTSSVTSSQSRRYNNHSSSDHDVISTTSSKKKTASRRSTSQSSTSSDLHTSPIQNGGSRKSNSPKNSKQNKTEQPGNHGNGDEKTRRIKDATLSNALTSLTNGHVNHGEVAKVELISAQSVIEKLEGTITKLSAEMIQLRRSERDSKCKIESVTCLERSMRSDLKKLKEENESLQMKYHNLFNGKQKDKLSLQSLEKRLKIEAENRANAEKMLQDEIKRSREEQESIKSAAAVTSKEREEYEELRKRKQELEGEVASVSGRLQQKDRDFDQLKSEVTQLKLREKSVKESETLMSALEAMQEKNAMLENSLSAETKIKLDLFSALGDAKRQLEITHRLILKRDSEIADLKSRMTDIVSVMPNSCVRPSTPHYSTPFLEKSPIVRMAASQAEFQGTYCHPQRTAVPTQLAAPAQMVPAHNQIGVDQGAMVNHLHSIHIDPALLYAPTTSAH